jgi:transcriptional regulator with XRE-family HTH domain
MFINNVKKVRTSQGKTQIETAKFLNITQPAYSKIESKNNPPIDIVFLLSDYFNVPITQLYSKQQ